MRRSILLLVFVLLLMLAAVPAASGHVHGVTPLGELGCKVDNSITCGHRAHNSPAGALGGPIGGLIPRDVGSGNIAFMGGFGAANDNVCP